MNKVYYINGEGELTTINCDVCRTLTVVEMLPMENVVCLGKVAPINMISYDLIPRKCYINGTEYYIAGRDVREYKTIYNMIAKGGIVLTTEESFLKYHIEELKERVKEDLKYHLIQELDKYIKIEVLADYNPDITKIRASITIKP